MKKVKLFGLLVLLLAAMTGCKYEEGPFISFVPKVERVANTWIVSSATINGVADNLDNYNRITFFKEGGFQIIFNSLVGEIAYGGTWSFDDKKETLIITSDDDLTGLTTWDRTMTILKLKEDALHVTWNEPGSPSDLYDVTFTPLAP